MEIKRYKDEKGFYYWKFDREITEQVQEVKTEIDTEVKKKRKR